MKKMLALCVGMFAVASLTHAVIVKSTGSICVPLLVSQMLFLFASGMVVLLSKL